MQSASTKTTAARGAVIFLHGLGDEGASWSFLGGESARLLWFYPDAPVTKVTCNRGARMRSWFDIDRIPIALDSNEEFGEADIIKSCESVHKIIRNLGTEHKIPPENVIVGGFSQGAALALMSCTTFTESKLRGCIMLSGWMPVRSKFAEKYVKKNEANLKSLPIFQAHGEADNVVEYALGKESNEVLRASLPSNESITWLSMPRVGHSISDAGIRTVEKWIDGRFSDI